MSVTAQIDGELAARLHRVKHLVGLSHSDMIRQGLIRIVSEVEATGALTCHPLPPAGPDALDMMPPQPSGRSVFDDDLDVIPRRPRRALTPRRQ